LLLIDGFLFWHLYNNFKKKFFGKNEKFNAKGNNTMISISLREAHPIIKDVNMDAYKR